MTKLMTPISWGGHSLQDANYHGRFVVFRQQVDSIANSPAQAVMTERPNSTPVFVMGQGGSRIIELEVVFENPTQQAIDDFKSWFDWERGQQLLVVENSDGVQMQRLCFPESATPTEGTPVLWHVNLKTSGNWESVTPDTIADATIAASGDTFDIPNGGTARSHPNFTIVPSEAKDAADGFTLRRRLILASQTELPMGDPVKDGGYPIDVTDGGLDTTGMSVQSDLFDLAVNLNSELLNRWPDPTTADAATKLFVNFAMRAKKTATLAANISSGDDTLSVGKPYPLDFDDWPKFNGFIYAGTELFMYASRDAGNFYGLTRGIRGTTAASHSAGDVLLWVEHRFLDLLYSWSAAPNPAPPDDEKPLISLPDSTNISHKWTYDFLNERDRRSRAFLRQHTDAGVGAQHVRQYVSASGLIFENDQAAAGKPALNDAVMEFPVPLAGPLVADIDVGYSMQIRGYVEDMEGYESRLIDQGYTATPLTAESYSLPDVVKKLRLTGSIPTIVGNLIDNDPIQFDAPATPGTAIPGPTPPEDASIEILQQYQNTAVKFVLKQDSPGIYGLIVDVAKASGATGDLSLFIMEDGGGRPAVDVVGDTVKAYFPHVLGGAIILNADLPVTTVTRLVVPLTRLNLPAGTYWLSYFRAAGDTGHFYTGNGSGVGANLFTTYVEGVLKTSEGMTFAILSDLTDPQEDAPLDNGDQIQIANIVAPLDSTRKPLIALQAEESFYDMRAARLENTANGTWIDLTFPTAIDKGLYVDTKAHRIIELETGIDIPFAGVPGSGIWPYQIPGTGIAASGVNRWRWTEVGARGLTVSIDHRQEWE